jgi:hypothetical protein
MGRQRCDRPDDDLTDQYADWEAEQHIDGSFEFRGG